MDFGYKLKKLQLRLWTMFRTHCQTLLLAALLMPLMGVGSAVLYAQGSGSTISSESETAPPRRTVIRFLTDGDHPPYNYYDEDQVLTGFNVSVARAICLELDVTCEITTRSWNALIPALDRSEADAVIAFIAKTAAMQDRVSFSMAYHYTPGRFAGRQGADEIDLTPAALYGRVIAVAAGSAHEAYIRTYFPDADIKSFSTPAEARTALRLGRAELLFDDAANIAIWMNGTDARGCCTFRGQAYYEPLFFGEGIAIAVRKGDQALIDDLNKAIRAIRKNRRLEEIFLQFFPIKIY